jgi:hypothetical protein
MIICAMYTPFPSFLADHDSVLFIKKIRSLSLRL